MDPKKTVVSVKKGVSFDGLEATNPLDNGRGKTRNIFWRRAQRRQSGSRKDGSGVGWLQRRNQGVHRHLKASSEGASPACCRLAPLNAVPVGRLNNTLNFVSVTN
ncbi:hypothetical protein V6N13_054615 [Hibiscus sabdariffa]|uniref:Uncharacterized protein n=1 Tax=Hibiscus sabdariffa TaxID=183260 RepID=A0ABR2DYX9_9ROSI